VVLEIPGTFGPPAFSGHPARTLLAENGLEEGGDAGEDRRVLDVER